LHAFDNHPRKSKITKVIATDLGKDHGGFDPGTPAAELLDTVTAMPNYTPGTVPTTPGHEPTGHIVAVGSKVTHHKAGERVLIQTDYRHLPTVYSNAAFGYDFEGALQQYTVVDERVVIDPKTGDRFLIPVSEAPTASQVALIEPWACVEAAYAWGERQSLTPLGRVLIVVDEGREIKGTNELIEDADPATVVVVGSKTPYALATQSLDSLSDLGADDRFDDIVYFGSDAATLETLGDHLDFAGLLSIVANGQRIDRPVSVDVGRVHYDLIRYTGTNSDTAAGAYDHIPASAELRDNEHLAIIGAAGPMGLMHTMRTAVSGVDGIKMDAVDVDDARLSHLGETVAPKAKENGVPASFRNSANEPLEDSYSYVSVMVPAPALIAQAVDLAGHNGIVNAFAGFALGTKADLDLNSVTERGVYLVGTSGSRIRDMAAMLKKVEAGVLDTNVSLAAVTGMAGVQEGIESVQNRTLTGKIMVYPQLVDLGLIRLEDLPEKLPQVAAKMIEGHWTKEAEEALLAMAD
jgi:threonine dehydrogenase-like Zn-dependent dehydrogenase